MSFFTRDDLVEYVKARLGAPLVSLELELQEKNGLGHIHLTIQDCLDWYYDNVQDKGSFRDWLKIYARAGVVWYDLPEDIVDVIDISPNFGNGFTPWTSFDVGAGESLISTSGWSQFDLCSYTGAMRYLSDVQKLVGQQFQVQFHAQSHRLRILPTPKNDTILIAEVYKKERIAEIFNQVNFRNLVVAHVKKIWGEILSHDQITLPGGGTVNGPGILAQGEKDIEKYEKFIIDRSTPPFIRTDLA
jgi:hypothetical protein